MAHSDSQDAIDSAGTKAAIRPWLAGLLLAIAGFFAVVAEPYIHRFGLSLAAALGIYSCFLLLVTLVLTPGMDRIRQWVEERKTPWLVVLWYVPYFLYVAGTGDFRWLAVAKLLLLLPVPMMYRLFPVREVARLGWQDILVAGWLIWILLRHLLTGVWNVPVNLDFMGRLLLLAVGSWTWVFVRRVPSLGYSLIVSWRVLRVAGGNFGLFAAIAIPASLAMHFTEWNPRPFGFFSFAVSFVEIFLFVALLEEMFFRGFLQTLVSETLGSARVGQVIISCLFGLFHILHAPVPNWRYVILATIAGWFYGSAFVKTGSLMTSALTHAMVDTVWRTFFSKS